MTTLDADGFPKVNSVEVEASMTLDCFQATHTTEDDESFQAILDLELTKRRKDMRWMLTDSSNHNNDMATQR